MGDSCFYAMIFIISGIISIIIDSILFLSVYRWYLKQNGKLKENYPIIYGLSILLAALMVCIGIYCIF